MISALLVGRRFGFGIPGAEELTTQLLRRQPVPPRNLCKSSVSDTV